MADSVEAGGGRVAEIVEGGVREAVEKVGGVKVEKVLF